MQKYYSTACSKYIISSSIHQQKVSCAKGHVAKLYVQRVLSVLLTSTVDAIPQGSLQIVNISSKADCFVKTHLKNTFRQSHQTMAEGEQTSVNKAVCHTKVCSWGVAGVHGHCTAVTVQSCILKLRCCGYALAYEILMAF